MSLSNSPGNQTDSLKKRYFYKLSNNIIGLPVSVVIQAIIPRALGPASYGNYNFLTSFFTEAVSFFDAGSSIAFYTKISQRQNEKTLIKFYSEYIIICSIVLIALFPIPFIFNLESKIWPEQETKFIFMGLIWAVISWYVQIFQKIIDAYGVTSKGEIAKILQKFVSLLLVASLWGMNFLNLETFFYYQYFILFLLIIFWWKILDKNSFEVFKVLSQKISNRKSYISEFYKYSSPLFVYVSFGFAVAIFDRWLLQKFGGSIQQGFFGLSYQVSAISFLFANAMTPLITREFSISFSRKNIPEMRRLFSRYIPMLYSVVGFFSVFLSVQAAKVIYIMGGSRFEGATLALAIMVLYPIHQTYGQLSGSVFYATGQTKLYRNVGVIMMIIGLPVTFFLIAPGKYGGLDYGATGLAIKMLAVQFIAVNIQLVLNAKFLELKLIRFIWHQVYSIGIFFILALASTYVADIIISNIIFGFIFGGFIYTILIIGATYLYPSVFAVSREEIINTLNKFLKKS